MKLTLGLVVLLLLGIVAARLFLVEGAARSVEPEPMAETLAPEPEPAAALTEDDAPEAPPREVVEADVEPESPAPEMAAPPEEPANPTAPEGPDLEAIDWLEIRVVDEEAQPVRDAELVIGGMRSESSPGSWYGYRGKEPAAKTDWEGRARLGHWVWVNQDGRAVSVDLRVSHPEFIAFRDDAFEVSDAERTVVLRRGPTVVLSAWITSPVQLVGELDIRLDRDSEVPADVWRREPDGRWSTTRIPKGVRALLVKHESEEHGLCYSEFTTFEVGESGYVEVDVQLFPAERLEGVLDPIVPRPIEDGRVLLVVQASEGPGGARSLDVSRRLEAGVDAEGAFTLAGLPRGRGQLFASCLGWSSSRTLLVWRNGVAPTLEEEAAILERDGDRGFGLQRFTIPSEAVTVRMERTGAVEVTVKRPDGAPLAGATIGASPNVRFHGYGSIITPWRDWSAKTDGQGRGTLTELPRSDSLWIHAFHDEFQMRAEDRKTFPAVRILPGQTAVLELTLERK